MDAIFEILLNAKKSNQIALDQAGRVPYPTRAVCVYNQDPESRRRIKVALPSNPSIQSDWVRRLDVTPHSDNPVPTIGQTVLIFYVDGLETDMYYLSLINDTNPAKDKQDPIKDCSREIPGNNELTVQGNYTKAVEGKITTNARDIELSSEEDFKVDTEKDISMTCDEKLTLFAQQYLKLQAGPSNWIELGANGDSSVSGNWVFDLGGATLSFVNVGGFSINGKQVATVNALDDDGDRIVDPGW